MMRYVPNHLPNHLTSSILLPALLFMGDCHSPPYQSPPEPTWYTWNDVGLVEIGRTTEWSSTTGSSTITDSVYASFRSIDTVGLEAGNVSFEGVSIPIHRTPLDSPAVFYRLTSGEGPVPIRLGGIPHTIRISGAGTIPPYEESLPSPDEIRIVRPVNGISISKRDGFEILYIEKPFRASYFEAEIHPSGGSGVRWPRINLLQGRGVVTPGMLKSASTGPLRLVVREVAETIDTVGGRRCRIRFISSLRYTIHLTD